MTKIELYRQISRTRRELGITEGSYPLDIVGLIRRKLPCIRLHRRKFETSGLHGVAVIDDGTDGVDVIVIDDNRMMHEQNFDCSHEFMHTRLHRSTEIRTFICSDSTASGASAYLEWEANEGASELLVPARMLIPELVERSRGGVSATYFYELKCDLACKYFVSAAVITTRIESLKYEIDQHIRGVPIERLKVLSRTEQERWGIKVDSLNDLENEQFVDQYANVGGEVDEEEDGDHENARWDDRTYWERLWLA